MEDQNDETFTDGKAGEEISLEEQEFLNYCKANDLETNTDDMSDDDKETFLKARQRFIKAEKSRRLTVDGTTLEYTVSKFSKTHAGDKLAIVRPNGKVVLAAGKGAGKDSAMASSAMMGALCGKETSYVNQLDIADRNFLQDILLLFLGA
jgi:hypothetical protein